jgi:hypothetical protein
MALPPREFSARRPWALSSWEGDLEAYRGDLYAGMAFGMHDVRAFAREWLEELLRVGYYGMGSRSDCPSNSSPETSSRRPDLALFAGRRTPHRWGRSDRSSGSGARGYREISVSDEPLRTDAARSDDAYRREGLYAC